jgi:hypothetical protein
VLLNVFTRALLGLVCIVTIQTLVYANTNNTTSISIGVVVPERAQNQKCVVGFKSNTRNFTPLESSGCHYNSAKLLQVAYQKATSVNSQGFVTVVVIAP